VDYGLSGWEMWAKMTVFPAGQCSTVDHRRNTGDEGQRIGEASETGGSPEFDVKSFLSSVGSGRSTEKYQRKKIIFRQGDPADGVFYIQSGKIELSVCPIKARKASLRC
jgi:hypothetical protein